MSMQSDPKVQFYDLRQAGDGPKMRGRERKSSGCYVSTVAGFTLLLLGVIMALGVGLMVFFATPRGQSAGDCPSAAHNGAVGTHSPGQTEEMTWDNCKSLAVERKECISSEYCSGGSATTTIVPATVAPRVTRLKDVRLPLDVTPVHYEVEIKPDIYGEKEEDFVFEGRVGIDLECKIPTRVIILHIKQLTIDNSSITLESSTTGLTPPQITNYTFDLEREFVKFHLNQDLAKGGAYRISLAFSGMLKEDLTGIYRSSYTNGNKTSWIATTQMQATDARKAFPCFDEPAIKATFSITLLRRHSKVSLSNMPINRTESREGGWRADVYEKSVRMPTYLLAMVICDFQYKEKRTTNGKVRFRVWARPEAIDQVDYALDIGVRILEYFETYFGLEYPLPKQDMIAIPDFAAGAMENWGLITYREAALLVDPLTSSTDDKQWVAQVVSHELAHQWFGNLVSPAWWDDLWLNEGFATFMEYYGIHHVEPAWRMMEQFINKDVHESMNRDSLSSSHPLYAPVYHPSDIGEIFDSISYSKGASIIRMADNFLPTGSLTKGLTRYLKKHAYGNANHTDLWNSLSEAAFLAGSDVDVAEVMNTWVKQMGFPMVTIKRDTNRDIAYVTQQRFLSDPEQIPSEKYPSPFHYKWRIPLTYTCGDSPNWTNPKIEWMNLGNIRIGPLNKTTPWIIGNVNVRGYYMMNYDLDNWEALVTQLTTDHAVIPSSNRAQLIHDAFKIGKAGHIDQLLALKMTNYLSAETEYLPWDAANDIFRYVDEMLSRSPSYGHFQSYIYNKVLPIYTRIGWSEMPGEKHLDKYLRGVILGNACLYGVRDCFDRAIRAYSDWMQNPNNNDVAKDKRSLVYCMAIKHGGVAEWDFAYEQYHKTSNSVEKTRLLYGMSCTPSSWIMNKFISMTWNSSEIRPQDSVYVFMYVSWSTLGRYIIWDYFIDNWDRIYERFQRGITVLSYIVDSVTYSFNTPYQLQKLKEFQQKNPDITGGNSAIRQAIEKAEVNIKWMERNEKKFSEWLASEAA